METNTYTPRRITLDDIMPLLDNAHGFARSLTSRDPEDIVQEAFERAVEDMAAGRTPFLITDEDPSSGMEPAAYLMRLVRDAHANASRDSFSAPRPTAHRHAVVHSARDALVNEGIKPTTEAIANRAGVSPRAVKAAQAASRSLTSYDALPVGAAAPEAFVEDDESAEIFGLSAADLAIIADKTFRVPAYLYTPGEIEKHHPGSRAAVVAYRADQHRRFCAGVVGLTPEQFATDAAHLSALDWASRLDDAETVPAYTLAEVAARHGMTPRQLENTWTRLKRAAREALTSN